MSENNTIYESMANVNEELNGIGKNQEGFNYKFRGIDDVLNTLNPLFKKHKIITLRRNLNSQREVRSFVDKYGKDKTFVEVFLQADYVFKSLIDGSEIVTQGFGEGQDTSGGDKASSMATSNSYKYVIFEMFNIATNEQKDSDQITAEVSKKNTTSKYKKEVKAAPKKEDKSEDAPKKTRFRKKKTEEDF